jgi:hypothetical protein
LEWLNKRIHSEIESRNFDKAIYIPIEGGDLTINMLYEFLLDTIEKYDIRKTTSIVGGSPLDSTINIVSSHGDINISSNEFIYPNDSSVVHNLDGILGSGKILILLVCHSGSATEHFFRNEISTIVKRYLVNGYEAVIAPFWSLHINVPPIWLPVFLEELEKGNEIPNPRSLGLYASLWKSVLQALTISLNKIIDLLFIPVSSFFECFSRIFFFYCCQYIFLYNLVLSNIIHNGKKVCQFQKWDSTKNILFEFDL